MAVKSHHKTAKYKKHTKCRRSAYTAGVITHTGDPHALAKRQTQQQHS